MSKIVDQHIPCPCGKSSDGYCTYDDDHGWCYSCYKRFNLKGDSSIEDQDFEMKHIPIRGLSKSTTEKYNILCKFYKKDPETPIEAGFIYPNGATKASAFKQKKFYSTGDMANAGLFGKDKFQAGGKVIFITEGEWDAPSIYEVTKQAAVSVRSGSSAKIDCKKDYDYLNSFDKIILAMDNDHIGQKAAREIASLFDYHKVFNVEFVKHKDANDYLQNKDSKELLEALKSHSKYTPSSISNSFSQIKEILKGSKESMIGTYPFAGLQSALHGLHKGEIVIFKGDEGIGKTEVFRALQNHLLKESDENRIGIFHLEEDNAQTVKGIANYYANYPYLHPDNAYKEDEIFETYMKALNDNDERVYIYESFDVEDHNILIDNIRFLVSACGCNFIFLDHITWLATGIESDDERKKLDNISQRLKLLAKELNFCLVVISHTNDEGKTRGSRNITKAADTVIHLQRDKVSPIENIRLRTNLLVEKGRIAGSTTGNAGFGMYDKENLVLLDGEY